MRNREMVWIAEWQRLLTWQIDQSQIVLNFVLVDSEKDRLGRNAHPAAGQMVSAFDHPSGNLRHVVHDYLFYALTTNGGELDLVSGNVFHAQLEWTACADVLRSWQLHATDRLEDGGFSHLDETGEQRALGESRHYRLIADDHDLWQRDFLHAKDLAHSIDFIEQLAVLVIVQLGVDYGERIVLARRLPLRCVSVLLHRLLSMNVRSDLKQIDQGTYVVSCFSPT